MTVKRNPNILDMVRDTLERKVMPGGMIAILGMDRFGGGMLVKYTLTYTSTIGTPKEVTSHRLAYMVSVIHPDRGVEVELVTTILCD